MPELDIERLEAEAEAAYDNQQDTARKANAIFYNLQDKIVHCIVGRQLMDMSTMLKVEKENITSEQYILLADNLLATAWSMLQKQTIDEELRAKMKEKAYPIRMKKNIFRRIALFFRKLAWLFTSETLPL